VRCGLDMQAMDFVERHGMVPLHETIMNSIMRAAKVEQVRKLLVSIILVGGSTRFRGFADLLKLRYRAIRHCCSAAWVSALVLTRRTV
jgi:actin-related protein